jgi:hypothetical protein
MIDFKKKENIVKISSLLVFLISIFFLIGWRIANKDVSLKFPIIIFSIISIICIIAFFSKDILKRIERKEENIPEQIDLKEIEEKIRKDFEERFWSHIKINGGLTSIKTKSINKNLICAYKINSIYEINLDDKKVNSIIAIINANYNKIPITYKLPDISENMIEKEMNNKSFSPYDEPDEEEEVKENALTGTRIITKKKSYPKKIREEEKSDIE